MPLSMLGPGLRAIVTGLTGKPEDKRVLTRLGFVTGKTVEIIQYSLGNRLIVGLGGLRLALDRRSAHCIQIVPSKEL